jgi:hypothetical protein
MGQQVNFFCYGSDERNLLEALRKRSADLCFLRYTSPSEAFEPMKELPAMDEPAWFHVWLWDRSICTPPVTQWVDKQGYYTIDPSASEVIEFLRPYEREGRLLRGRLWAEISGWRMSAPTERVEKSAAFRKWFNSLTGWIKRHYTRTAGGDYLGPGAAEFYRRGGVLVQADFAPVVKIVKH